MEKKEIETICPASPEEWRQWLQENHNVKESVCLILYKKESGKPVIHWSDAVDQALCFGWIDGKRKPVDAEQFMQSFSRRKPRGTWSKINKAKIQQLTERGLMTQAGLDVIENAKRNGSWTILDEVEELVVPDDLEEEFGNHPGAREYFFGLSKSVKKIILQWLVLAKRPETRRKRVVEVAEQAALNQRPPQFR